jgi:hypothetical protein
MILPLRTTYSLSIPVLFAAALAACGEGNARTSLAVRETLPDGRVVVTYPSRPAGVDTVVADVRIGSEDGTGPDVFGDVRGIEVGDDGTIYVLDYLAAEVRAFAPDGRHVATLARKGAGPGELSEPNGMAFGPDGTLWVNDHGNGVLIGLSKEGREEGRHPRIVPGYGYLWSGGIDSSGVFREQWSHALREVEHDIEATGIVEGQTRQYFKSFDPRTQAYESVIIGLATYRSLRAAYPGGQMVMGLPFAPSSIAALDRAGNVWTASSDAYTITRASAAGDTLLVLKVEETAPAVTAEDRAEWEEGMSRVFERVPSIRAELESHIPERKPILTQLVTDDEGRLWVGRTVPAGEAPLYDVFDREGEYLGATRLFEGMSAYLPFVVRRGRVYAMVRDDLDVPYVVSGPVPAFAAKS